MKQYIVLCSTIILGIFIYYLIMGDQSDSIINSLRDLWQHSLGVRTYTD